MALTADSRTGRAIHTASPRAGAAFGARAGSAGTTACRYSTRVVTTTVLVSRLVLPLFADCDHIDVRICVRATGACRHPENRLAFCRIYTSVVW